MSNFYIEGLANPGETTFEAVATESFDPGRIVAACEIGLDQLDLRSLRIADREQVSTVAPGDSPRESGIAIAMSGGGPAAIPLVCFEERPGFGPGMTSPTDGVVAGKKVTFVIGNSGSTPRFVKLRLTDEPAPEAPSPEVPEDVFPLISRDDHEKLPGLSENGHRRQFIIGLDSRRLPAGRVRVESKPTRIDLAPRLIIVPSVPGAGHVLHDIEIAGKSALRRPLTSPISCLEFSEGKSWKKLLDIGICPEGATITLVVERVSGNAEFTAAVICDLNPNGRHVHSPRCHEPMVENEPCAFHPDLGKPYPVCDAKCVRCGHLCFEHPFYRCGAPGPACTDVSDCKCSGLQKEIPPGQNQRFVILSKENPRS
jgi:hypothetical protein